MILQQRGEVEEKRAAKKDLVLIAEHTWLDGEKIGNGDDTELRCSSVFQRIDEVLCDPLHLGDLRV